MNPLEYLLDHTPRLAAPPEPFGAFHLVSLGLILLAAMAMVIFRRHLPRGERNLRRVLWGFALGLFLLEMGKQMVYSYTPSGEWAYNWDRFPFQFCSVPIYVALVAMWLRDGRLRRAFLAFLATYSPVAGGAVLFYPSSDVFHEILFLNVHTMIWHGAMVLFGLYLWLTEAVRPTANTALGAAAVYLPVPFVALLLNEAEHAWGFAGEWTFNMFYISRHGRCFIPILSTIQQRLPYPVFFFSYTLALGVGGLAIVGIMAVCRWIWQRGNREKLCPGTNTFS